MTPAQLADVLEEIAAWKLEDRRAYIANLAMTNAEEAEQVKAGLLAVWEKRKR
jgi:hypothetical protein